MTGLVDWEQEGYNGVQTFIFDSVQEYHALKYPRRPAAFRTPATFACRPGIIVKLLYLPGIQQTARRGYERAGGARFNGATNLSFLLPLALR